LETPEWNHQPVGLAKHIHAHPQLLLGLAGFAHLAHACELLLQRGGNRARLRAARRLGRWGIRAVQRYQMWRIRPMGEGDPFRLLAGAHAIQLVFQIGQHFADLLAGLARHHLLAVIAGQCHHESQAGDQGQRGQPGQAPEDGAWKERGQAHGGDQRSPPSGTNT
jgi:hypothetical protein